MGKTFHGSTGTAVKRYRTRERFEKLQKYEYWPFSLSTWFITFTIHSAFSAVSLPPNPCSTASCMTVQLLKTNRTESNKISELASAILEFVIVFDIPLVEVTAGAFSPCLCGLLICFCQDFQFFFTCEIHNLCNEAIVWTCIPGCIGTFHRHTLSWGSGEGWM